ncbi:MAG: hypothetical protein P4L43_20445 [Syntrophobacteraceae bacterium]|nr:hypothetical protein [Syntrophobacteraceae bacterium]
MSKKKRIRRDIDKYFRSGRYWELLRLLESEGLVSANANEYRESWKSVIGDALKRERGFDQFRGEVGALKSPPNDPGFRFLARLAGFIEGRNTAEDVLELKGLPPDAERLRSNFADFISSQPTGDKLRTVLQKFILEPAKITRRHYEQLAGMLPDALRKSASDLGELIASARRFNNKAVASGGWDAIGISDLQKLDRSLLARTDAMPTGFREVLLHPFVRNLALMCQRLAPEALINQASQLVGSMPFLLPRLAGEKLDEVERKLSINCRQSMDGNTENRHDDFARKAESLSIEEKLALLSDLRLEVRSNRSGEPDLDFSDFFDDEEEWDDDAFAQEQNQHMPQLTEQLLFLYGRILADISSRLPGLSPREKKELVRVMEPIVLQDLEFTRNSIQSGQKLMDFLDAVLKANCAGVRTGLLTVLICSHYRNGGLRKRAEKYLDQLASPTQQDMEWLATQWAGYYYPKVGSLKPLLTRYEQNEGLLGIFATQICSSLELSLCEPLILADTPLFRLGDRKINKPAEPGIVRRELDALAEYKLLDLVRNYLRCHPEDRFTVDGHLCWLNAVRSHRPAGVWQFALNELRRGGRVENMEDDFFPLKSLDRMITEKFEAVILFMTEHSDELATLPMASLDPLLNELLAHPRIRPGHAPFLIRLEKALAGKVEAGETGARQAMDKIRRLMLKLVKSGSKNSSKRKHRR